MPYSPAAKEQLTQKVVWLPNDLADRLEAVVRMRKRRTTTYSERRAIAEALRAHLEKEEAELGIDADAGSSSPGKR